MTDTKVNFRETIFKDSSDAVNEYADGFAYSSFGDVGARFGSIAIFKHVSDWVNNEEIQPVRYQIANIRMSENQLLELAKYIVSQHEESKKLS